MLNPGHQNSRLILELRPLRLKIFFGIFAGAIFEAKVAQVFVELILALQQVVHASLLPLAGKHVLWPEGVKQQRNCQQSAHYYALQCCHCLKPSVVAGICLTANFFTSRQFPRVHACWGGSNGCLCSSHRPETYQKNSAQHGCAEYCEWRNPGHEIKSSRGGRSQHNRSVLGDKYVLDLLVALPVGDGRL